MFSIRQEASRTKEFTVTIKSPTGGYIQLESSDVVRIKIGLCNTVVLDLDEAAPSANGSSITRLYNGDGSSVHASVVLRLDQNDVVGLKGTYSMEVNVVDNSDSSKIKPADYGAITFEESQGGDVGLT